MTYKAFDTLHLSELGPMPLVAGQQFEVSELVGKELVERGLAEKVDANAPPPVKKRAK